MRSAAPEGYATTPSISNRATLTDPDLKGLPEGLKVASNPLAFGALVPPSTPAAKRAFCNGDVDDENDVERPIRA